MKPDRKQPGRATALRPLTAARTPEAQLQDWYVIADEGDLTLRISSGLRVGEDRWGELTLNHPLSAHRWLEFTIDGDGALWCRSSRKDIAIRIDGTILDEVQLDAGVPIALPHNLLHISNFINRGKANNWQLDIGLLETDDTGSNSQFDQAVDTQPDVPNATLPPSSAIIGQTETKTSIPNPQDQAGQTQGKATGIPTLETVVAASRPLASSDAGPAIERAVAKLKSRTGSFPAYRHRANQDHGTQAELADTAEAVESALVPVDANGPFHTDEIRAALQQPITLSEPAYAPNPQAPIYAPNVTTSVTNTTSPIQNQQKLVAGLGLTLLVVTGIALVVALSAVPDNYQDRSLYGGQRGLDQTALPKTGQPAENPNTARTATTLATVVPNTSQARIESLLQTASALLADAPSLDDDTLDFAIRSLNLVLAAEPGNGQAADMLNRATSEQRTRISNRLTNEQTGQRLTTTDTGPVPIVPTPDAPARQTVEPDTGATSPTDAPMTQTPSLNTAVANPGPRERFALVDWRLREANRLLGTGNVLRPRDASAVNLILSVLAEDPNHLNAIRMLNKSADQLLVQADFEYRTQGEYAARNTLEEILSFHPRHAGANQRWRNWVGAR